MTEATVGSGWRRWLARGGARHDAWQPSVLIVTSRHRLWQRHGPEGVFAIERAVGDLVSAMAEHGLSGTLVYVDDSPLLTRLGLLPAEPGTADTITTLVRAVAERLAWTEEAVRYLLVLGDDGIVPFHRLENPTLDADETVLSDHPYGAQAEAPLLPALAVGRLPDAGLGTLLAALAAAAEGHRRVAAGGAAGGEGAFGYSASVWKRAARQVFGTVGDPRRLRLSPPLSHRELPDPGPNGPRYRYFNLHGLEDSAEWLGQLDPAYPADYSSFPVALRPEDVAEAPGRVVFSEACYGAHLHGRAVHDSIALSCLRAGALAFVGATGVAYGGLDGPLVAADLLAARFWRAVQAGAASGQALAWAKASLVEDAMARQGYVDAEEAKAIHNFVLYGDPSLAHRASSVWAEDAAAASLQGPVEGVGPMVSVGTPSVRPRFLSGPAAGSEGDALPSAGLVDHVRRVVAHRLPEFGGDDVRVSTAAMAGPARGAAHGVAGEAAVRRVVVTLTKSVRTSAGPTCAEVVRVTVDSGGQIRRVAVSR
jgi:hypothetical protein